MRLVSEIADAILRGDKEIKMGENDIIKIPSPQRSGTNAQQQTYANMKALEVFEKYQKR